LDLSTPNAEIHVYVVYQNCENRTLPVFSKVLSVRDQSNNWQHQLWFFSRCWLFHLQQKVPVIRNVTSYSAGTRKSYLTVTEGNCLTVNSSLVSKLAAW